MLFCVLRTTNASNKKNGAMGPATVTLERMRVTVMELSSWIKENGLGEDESNCDGVE